MSKVAIEGNASGTGTFTIASPNSNSNRTLTLPDNTGTIVTQNSTPAFASTIGVGGATPSSSGAGITFPASQSASTDANTLDDYEEGTWTPTVTINNDATGITYDSQIARYTKIGNLVQVSAYVALTNKGASTGTVRLASLPFVTKNVTAFYQGSAVGWYSGTTGITAGIGIDLGPGNVTTAPFFYFGPNNSITLTNAQITNNFAFEFSFCYQTN